MVIFDFTHPFGKGVQMKIGAVPITMSSAYQVKTSVTVDGPCHADSLLLTSGQVDSFLSNFGLKS
jgi:hypothetical protein